MTMLRGHVEPEVKVQMARDIFICILGFCLVTSILFILRRLPSCSQPVNSYKVDVLDGVSEKTNAKRKSLKTRKIKDKETKVNMPETFTSPTNDAILMCDKFAQPNKEQETMHE